MCLDIGKRRDLVSKSAIKSKPLPTLAKKCLACAQMPGMDGLTLLERIKQRFPDIPVMMVTAYGDDERRRRASDLGACEFLAKPVDFDVLKAQLRQLSIGATD